MSDPILQDIASQLSRMDAEIERAQSLISVAEESGENMSEQKAKLRDAVQRRNKWKATLESRGYTV